MPVASPAASTEFRATLVAGVLILEGELDLATAPDLERALAGAEELLASDGLTVDLRSLTFMDAAGVRVLVSAAGRARRSGRSLVTVPATGPPARLLRLLGLGDALTVPPLEQEDPRGPAATAGTAHDRSSDGTPVAM